MSESVPAHLRLYDQRYFRGERAVSGYDDYANCSGVLQRWAQMVEAQVQPTSVLDVGAAYGFVVQFFRDRGRIAQGVEPSAFARSQVPGHLAALIHAGALPEVPETIPAQFHTVTCTEVLEHVPEDLVPASLAALAAKAERYVIALIMLEGPGADGDEGHICLKSRQWWEDQFAAVAPEFQPARAIEQALNTDPYSVNMYWATRIFVWERVAA